MNPESEHTDEYYYNVLKDGLNEFKRKGSNSTKYRCPFCWNNDYHYLSDVRKHAARIVGDTRETETERAKHSALIRYIDSLDTDQDKSSAVIGQDKSSGDELFVWPWIVILANNVEKFDPKRSKYVRKNDNEIKEELLLKGFKPLKVTVLGDNKGQTPFAIVEFGTEWDDFHNAVRLERSFQEEHYGKKDYLNLKHWYKGDKLYGWMARVQDFENCEDEFGRYLRDHTDLKVVSRKEVEDNKKASKISEAGEFEPSTKRKKV